MSAAKYDLSIEQGTTFVQQFIWSNDSLTAYNLTGYTARMSIKTAIGAAASLIDLTTGNGRIVITAPTAGTFQIQLTATETAAFAWTKAVYDLELVSSGGVVTRLLKGNVVVDPEITTL